MNPETLAMVGASLASAFGLMKMVLASQESQFVRLISLLEEALGRHSAALDALESTVRESMAVQRATADFGFDMRREE